MLAESFAERVVEILQVRGITCFAEPFDGSIHVSDDGAWWHWGTAAETWCADLMRDPAVGDMIGHAHTDIPSDTDDPEAVAGAIIVALNEGEDVEIYI